MTLQRVFWHFWRQHRGCHSVLADRLRSTRRHLSRSHVRCLRSLHEPDSSAVGGGAVKREERVARFRDDLTLAAEALHCQSDASVTRVAIVSDLLSPSKRSSAHTLSAVARNTHPSPTSSTWDHVDVSYGCFTAVFWRQSCCRRKSTPL